jgi:hypothetical protein
MTIQTATGKHFKVISISKPTTRYWGHTRKHVLHVLAKFSDFKRYQPYAHVHKYI